MKTVISAAGNLKRENPTMNEVCHIYVSRDQHKYLKVVRLLYVFKGPSRRINQFGVLFIFI